MSFESASSVIIIATFASIIMFLISGIIIKRHENCFREFYCVLRDKHPKSHVKQNAITKAVLRFFNVKPNGTIHFLAAIFHYVQIAILMSPAVMLSGLFFSIEKATVVAFIVGWVLFILFWIVIEVFTAAQMIRCERIKKQHPEYADRELHRRCGNYIL